MLDSTEEFFDDLSARALARAKSAPELVDVIPIAHRGWVLEYSLGGGQTIGINTLVSDYDNAELEYSYRPPPPKAANRKRLVRAGLLLCRALEQVELDSLPPLVVGSDRPPDVERDDLPLYLPGDCDRGCVFCPRSLERERERLGLRRPSHDLPIVTPASHPAGAVGWAETEARLREHAERAADIHVGWSGKDCLSSPLFDDAVRLAHELGFRDMSVQTPGSRLLEPGFIEFLQAHSVTHVALTAHAASEAVFDRVGGKPGAYRMFWQAFERLLAEDFELSVEVPCVAATVDELPDHLAHLASFNCALTCFYWYPDDKMNHLFATVGVPFERAIAALEAARLQTPSKRVSIGGIPECVAPAALVEHFRWDYDVHLGFVDFERAPRCGDCGIADRCPGFAPIYRQHHRLPAGRRVRARPRSPN